MDVSLLIRQRLKELGLGQRDLAAAAEVTESYISQLLARKKLPPAPGRTEIYEKIGKVLKLPRGELSRLAELQRREELRKKAADPPGPLFAEWRELILRKCCPARRKELRRIFEKEPFGELERLVTRTLLDVAREIARGERERADCPGKTRAVILKFLDVDVFSVSVERGIPFLNRMIDTWDIDLKTFGIEVTLKGRRATSNLKRFEFVERQPSPPISPARGLNQFLKDKSLSGDATDEEIEFLAALRLRGRQPTPIYYYRELQNLRDPLHFHHERSPGLSRDEPG